MIDAARIIQDYAAGGTSHRKLAQKYGTSVGTIGRILRGQAVEKPAPKLLAFPAPKARDEKPADWDNWQDALSTFRRKGYITVAHDCDVHLPDHDEQAVNMRYRLYARRQPDVIVVGSDAADFSVLSSFEGDPDSEDAVDDALYQFKAYWKPHIDNLNALCPNAVKVFLYGNHEQRVLSYLYRNAPKLRRTVQEAWLSTIRYGGVQYIGHTEEVEIGTLLVMHGNRANEHAALSLLSDQAYQVSVMAGHVHRLTYADREGRRYMVQACTSGCAQKLIPEYVATKGHSMTRKWQHGVAFGTVDMRSTFVDLDNIRFSRQNGIMLAHLDGEVLEQAADSDTKGRAA